MKNRTRLLLLALPIVVTALWFWQRPAGDEKPEVPALNPSATAAGESSEPSPRQFNKRQSGQTSSFTQAINQQVDALLEASTQSLTSAPTPEAWYARLSPAQKMEFRQRCLTEDGAGIRNVVAEHLKYHQQHHLKTWKREQDLLQAMQTRCDQLAPFVNDLLADTLADDAIDADTGLGALALDLQALKEENGLDAAAALARAHLMDSSPQKRADARNFLIETGAFLDLVTDYLPPEGADQLRAANRSHLNLEGLRQTANALLTVVDCESGLRDCGPGSFWALQQCRDYPRSCGLSAYEALHYNTPPLLMQHYDRLLQALRAMQAP